MARNVAYPFLEGDMSKSRSAGRDSSTYRLGQRKSAVVIRLPGSMIVQFMLLDELVPVTIGSFPRQIMP